MTHYDVYVVDALLLYSICSMCYISTFQHIALCFIVLCLYVVYIYIYVIVLFNGPEGLPGELRPDEHAGQEPQEPELNS